MRCECTNQIINKLRGHLKSSHIAEKRKKFHMALYPLPPSSNESVINNCNGRNVWQMAVHIILILSQDLPKQCFLSHAGTLPWWFSVHCEMNEQTISNSQRKIRFLVFSSFPARSKAGGRCRSAQSNWSECLS